MPPKTVHRSPPFQLQPPSLYSAALFLPDAGLTAMADERPNLMKLLDRVRDLPALPQVLMKLLRCINDEVSGAQQVGSVVSHDTALATKVLRVANSSFYARSSHVDSIQEAITIVGFSTLRSLTVSSSVISYFGSRTGFSHLAFWQQSLGVALLAEFLAKQSRVVNAGGAFTAGLLHDIGKIVFEQNLPKTFAGVLAYARAKKLTFNAAEKLLVDGSSAELASALAKHWSLPEVLQGVTAHWEHPERCRDAATGRLTATVHLARYLYRAQGTDATLDFDELGEINEQMWAALSLPPLTELALSIYECIARTQVLTGEINGLLKTPAPKTTKN
ncbi:MAG: HDOD domain-containing protein [Planctomycetota bacterium]|nr:HDOD domain-containing protein [Planctomycetota bacterium]